MGDTLRYRAIGGYRRQARFNSNYRRISANAMATQIRLKNVSDVIAQCWSSAEVETSEAVRNKYWGPTEEQITFLFSGALRGTVELASRDRKFENAFVADLVAACPALSGKIADVAGGLMGSVNFHNRYHEGKRSGADIGLLITQPWAERLGWPEEIRIETQYARALLAQAKLGRLKTMKRNSAQKLSWGRLTDRQKLLIPQHAEYYSLLLYCLTGAESRVLGALRWQLCSGYSVSDIQEWLRRGGFPEERNSADVIGALAAGTVGTDDEQFCSMIANPHSPPAQRIEIHVGWPDSRRPPDGLTLRQHVAAHQQHVLQRWT
jgi:hypothetical protein